MFANITTSRSVFYRFKLRDWEFKMENFIDTEDGIESILHVYKNGSNISPSYFGTIKEICTKLTEIVTT